MFYNYTFNRPVSPHLSIYLPQISSMFSIWHRISGVSLIIGLISFLLLSKIALDLSFVIPVFYILFLPNWFYVFFYLTYTFIFVYHTLNGIRHMLWDLFLFMELRIFSLSAVFLVIFLFLIVIFTL